MRGRSQAKRLAPTNTGTYEYSFEFGYGKAGVISATPVMPAPDAFPHLLDSVVRDGSE